MARLAEVLDLARDHPFDPPPSLLGLDPVTPMSLPGGGTGWMVTGFDEVCTVLSDPRFLVLRDMADSSLVQLSPETAAAFRQRRLAGALLRADPPEHTAYRRRVVSHFTMRRLRALGSRMEQIAADALDAMVAKGPPADLVADFAVPLPATVMCDLLGVSYAECRPFLAITTAALRLDVTPEEHLELGDRLLAYVREIVARKKAEPDDALLSELLTADGDPAGPLSEEEVTCLGTELLLAGYESSANMLGLGTFALLTHPEQMAALAARPELIDNAVEELLRYLSVIHVGPVRRTVEDVALGGHVIRPGETVMVSLPRANRDPDRFPDPDRLDISRHPTQHVAFGHGRHLCLGHQLARIELSIGFTALLARLPTLRLAVPAADIPLRTDMGIYGVHRLPVTWDASDVAPVT